MRILIVHGCGKKKNGVSTNESFQQEVFRYIQELEKMEPDTIEVLERNSNNLSEFLFDLTSMYGDPKRAMNFDQLDFVLVNGVTDELPWSPRNKQLVLLVKMCMIAGKCFYGSGSGAAIIAYLCATGGEILRINSGDVRGSINADPEGISTPYTTDISPKKRSTYNHRDLNVRVNAKTGDYFRFDNQQNAWIPKGNTGILKHSSDTARDYGARLYIAHAGIKSCQKKLSDAIYFSKRGDTKCCCRLEHFNHMLFRDFQQREFLTNCNSEWNLDEEIIATGQNKYRVLVDSRRGPMLVEFGNCYGSHFSLSKDYPVTYKLLWNFLIAKYEELKVHTHLNHRYFSVMLRPNKLTHKLQANKIIKHTNTKNANEKMDSCAKVDSAEPRMKKIIVGNNHCGEESNNPSVMVEGNYSASKKLRPVSAAVSRPTSQRQMRKINSARPDYDRGKQPPKIFKKPAYKDLLNSQNTVSFNNKCVSYSQAMSATTLSMDRIGTKSLNNIGDLDFKRLNDMETFQDANTIKNQIQVPEPVIDKPELLPYSKKLAEPIPRTIRIPQKIDLQKPYCAHKKFEALQQKQSYSGYYSVVNDAPYQSKYEQDSVIYQKNKVQWIGGPFLTTFGKRSTQITPEPSIFVGEMYDESTTPRNILNR